MLGFEDAFGERPDWNGSRRTFLNIDHDREVEKLVEGFLSKQVECIVCMDDFLCDCVLNVMQKRQVKVPEQVQVVSFYDSTVLENRVPAITSIRFDVEELGKKACDLLLRMLDGEDVQERTLLGYEVRMRKSTKSFSQPY